jgi:hypothetical protein
MPPRDLTAEDIADWLTPGQAVKILDAAFQRSYLSKQALLGRLAGGMAEAVSEQTVKNDSAGSSAVCRTQPITREGVTQVWRIKKVPAGTYAIAQFMTPSTTEKATGKVGF